MMANPHENDMDLCPLENRSAERYPFKTPVVLRHFNHEADFHALLLNYSKCGLCLRSHSRFNANSVLMVQLISENLVRTTHKIEDGFRSMTLAEVRWCNEITSKNGTCFEVGLLYYNI